MLPIDLNSLEQLDTSDWNQDDFNQFDVDGDGDVDFDDMTQLGIEPGSPEAILFWNKVVLPSTKQGVTLVNSIKWPGLKGTYKLKPLRPGPHPGDGDFDLVRDTARAKQGVSFERGTLIAGGVRRNLGRG